MEKTPDYNLRNRLVQHIKGGEAFTTVGNLLQKIAFDQLGKIPEGLPYSFYQLFWHIRFAQLDILEYCLGEDYQTPKWPDDYWPQQQAPANKEDWKGLKSAYFNEREALCDIVRDTSNNLMEPLPQNPDHNLIRQIEIVIEHTAYHTGQLHMLYRLLNK